MSTSKRGATYTQFKLEELDQFLKRAFRALKPTRKEGSSDYFYDLYLSDGVKIQVWSSIYIGDTEVKGSDRPPMKILFMTRKKGRMNPKPDIVVKRVAGWRDNLRERIEELVELYHVDPEGWENGTKDWDQAEYKKVAAGVS